MTLECPSHPRHQQQSSSSIARLVSIRLSLHHPCSSHSRHRGAPSRRCRITTASSVEAREASCAQNEARPTISALGVASAATRPHATLPSTLILTILADTVSFVPLSRTKATCYHKLHHGHDRQASGESLHNGLRSMIRPSNQTPRHHSASQTMPPARRIARPFPTS